MKKRWICTVVLALLAALALVAGCSSVVETEKRTVTFISLGEVYDVQEVPVGEPFVFPEDPARHQVDDEHYQDFAFWTIDPDMNYYRSPMMEEPEIVAGDLTLYAVYGPEKKYDSSTHEGADQEYQIKFRMPRGDDFGEYSGVTLTEFSHTVHRYDDVTNIPTAEDMPEIEGYHFTGRWEGGSLTNVLGSRLFTAVYEKNTYHFVWHYLGETSSRDVLFKDPIDLRETPSVESAFLFDGWYTDETFGTPATYTEVPAGDVHVYAKYKVDFSVATVVTEGNMVYGDADNKLYVSGLIPADGLQYSYVWTVDGQVGQPTADWRYNLKDAGTYTVSVRIFADYKNGILHDEGDARSENVQNPTQFAFTLEQATLTAEEVTLSATSLVYGNPAPEAHATYTGFQFGETAEGVGVGQDFVYLKGAEDVTGQNLHVGHYTVETHPHALKNYKFAPIEPLSFDVTPAELTVTYTVEGGTYGVLFNPVFDFDTFQFDDDEHVLGAHAFTLDGGEEIVGGERLNAGAHSVLLHGFDSEDYNVHLPADASSFTIDKRQARASLSATGGIYGVEPELGFTFDNVLEDDKAKFTPTYSFTRDGSGTYSDPDRFIVGNYTVTATFTENGSENYEPLTVTGAQFEITKKALTVSVSVDESYVYGETVSPAVVFEDAFEFGEDEHTYGLVKGILHLVYRTVDAPETEYQHSPFEADHYTVEVSGYSADNYEFSFPQSSFEVTKKGLTLTVHLTKTDLLYGEKPATENTSAYLNGVEYDGFIEREDARSVFGLNLPTVSYFKASGESAADFHAGKYYATTSADPANYAVTVVRADFTVRPRTLYVGISLDQNSLVYGEKPHASVVYTHDGYDGFLAGEQSLAADAYIEYVGAETYTQSDLDGAAKMVAGGYALSVKGIPALGDYELTYQQGVTFTVEKKALTVTLTDGHTYTYGDTPAVKVNFGEFAYDENATSLFGAKAETIFYFKDGAAEHYTAKKYFDAGSYTATLEGLENANYTIDVVKASFTVSPKALTVTVTANGFTYGDQDLPTPVLKYSGFVPDEDEGVLGGAPVYTYLREGQAYADREYFDAGSYTVSVEGYSSENYTIQYVKGTFNVAKRTAPATLTATGGTYGDTPVVSHSAPKILERDLAGFGFRYTYTFSTTASGQKTAYDPQNYTYYQAGWYQVTLVFTPNDNYTVTARPANFQIAKKALTVGVEGVESSYVYGNLPEPALTFKGFVGNEGNTVFTKKPDTEFTYYDEGGRNTSPRNFPVGNYFVGATAGYEAANYTVSSEEKTAFCITKADLTVTVSADGITYGGTPHPTLSYSAFAFTDSARDLKGTATYTYFLGGTQKDGLLHAGEYTVEVSGLTSANYEIHFMSGTFTVSPKALTVTATVADITYGETPAPSVKYEGFVPDEDKHVLGGELKFDYSGEKNGERLRAGVHTLTLSGYVTADYTVSYEGTSFTVKPRDITITLGKGWTTYADDPAEYTWYTVSGTMYDSELTFDASVRKGEDGYEVGSDRYFPHGQYTVSVSYNVNSDYRVTAGGAELEGSTSFGFTVAKRSVAISTSGTQPWATRDAWQFVPTMADSRFTLTGTLVLKDAESLTAKEYTASDLNGVFGWKEDVKITLTESGADVTDNFEFTYALALVLSNSNFSIEKPNAEFTYDSAEHSFEVTATASGVDEGDIHIEYKTEEGGVYGDTVPSFTDAGDYTVYYRVTAPNCDPEEGNFAVKGNKATPVLENVTDKATYTYDSETETQVAEDTVREAVVKNNVYSDAEVKYSLTESDFGAFPNVKDAGSYTITVQVSGKNYETRTATYTLTVGKAAVEAPEIAHKTYNQDLQQADVDTADALYYVKENDGGTDAGDYNVVLELNDPANYKWQGHDGDTESDALTLTFVIDRAQGSIDTHGVTTEYTYDGTQHVIESGATFVGDGTLTYSNNTFTDVPAGGKLVVKIALSDGTNYLGTQTTVTVTVKKAQAAINMEDVDFGGLTGEGTARSATYKGAAYTVGWKKAKPADTFNDTLTADLIHVAGDDSFTNYKEGGYTVTLTIDGTDNYDGASLTYTITIDKATPDVADGGASFTYNTQDQSEEIASNFTVTGVFGGDYTVQYQLAEGEWQDHLRAITAAGTYQIKVQISGANYETVEKSFSVTVGKATFNTEGVTEPEAVVYNGKLQGRTETELKALVKALGSDEFTVTFEGDGQFTDAGDHEVTYKVSGNDNYEDYTGSYTVRIEKAAAQLDVTGIKTKYTFTAAEQSVNLNAAKATSGISDATGYGAITFEKDGAPITEFKFTDVADGDGVTITVKLADGTNFTGTETTITLTVDKAEYHVSAPAQTFDYDTTEHGDAITVSGLEADTSLKAGDYTVTYDGKDTVAKYKNYQDGGYTVQYAVSESANYNAANGNYKIVINKAKPTLENFADDAVYTYDKDTDTQVTEDTVRGKVIKGNVYDDATVEYSLDAVAYGEFPQIKNAGSYTITVKVSGANYAETTATYTLTVARQQVTVTLPAELTVKYDGKEHGEGVKINTDDALENVVSSISYSVLSGSTTDDAPKFTKVGQYSVSVSITPTDNYTFESDDGNFKGTYKVNIDKAKAVIVTGHTDSSDLTYGATYALSEKEISSKLDTTDEIKPAVTTKVTYQAFGAAAASPFEGETFENAGKYVVTLSAAGDANYDAADDVTFTITINRKQLAKPTADPKSFTYNKNAQTYTLGGFDEKTMKVEGKELTQTAAGDYAFTVSLLDKTNYEWADSTQDAVPFTFHIAKAKAVAPADKPTKIEDVLRGNGKTLGEVELADYYFWVDDGAELGTEPSRTAQAYYNPDSANYENSDPFDVTITTKATMITVSEDAVYGVDWAETFDEAAFKTWFFETACGGLSAFDIDLDLHSANTKIGSTYLSTFSLPAAMQAYYEFSTGETVDIVFKIKSVDVSGKLYTIEDALATAASGNVIVKYDTAFAAKEIADRVGYADGNYTVKQGVTLILPYNGKDFVAGQIDSTSTGSSLKYETGINTTTGATGSSTFGVAGRKKIELTVPDNFTLYNEGMIRVGGVTSGAQTYAGGTSGDYAQITLGANAVLESNGDIDIYGFIVEAGNNNGSKLNMNKGTLRMTFRVVEHRGGSAYAAIVSGGLKGAPFNRYYMENCTATLLFKSAAHLLGYANLVASSHDNTTDIKLAGSSSNEMIQLQGDSYFTMKFDHATLVANINIYGSFKLNPLQMSAAGATVNMNQTYFPFSYLQQITLSPNGDTPATVDCTGQNIKLFPGAKVTIEKNVTVNASNIVIYTSTYVDENEYGSVAAWKYPTEGKGDGLLIIAGTLNADGIGGPVLASGSDATLKISQTNNIQSYEVKTVKAASFLSSCTWSSYTNVLSGPVYYHSGNQEKQTLSAGTYISKNGAWITDDSTFEVKYQFFACENEDGEKKAIVNNEGVNINNPVSYTHAGFMLTEPSYDGYEFVGWFTDPTCTQGLDSTTIDGTKHNNETIMLYGLFQKLPEGIVNYTLTLNGNGGEVNGQDSSVVSIKSTNLDEYSLPQLTREGYDFLGWTKTQSASDTTYIEKLEAEDFADGNAATLYAQWRIKNYDLKLDINTNTSLTVTVTTNGTDQDYSESGTFKVPYGSTVRIKSGSANSGYSSFTVSSDPTGLVTKVGSEFKMTENVTITTSATKDSGGIPCVVEGTLITLADGTQKPVEDLLPTDQLLVFNHETGRYEVCALWSNVHAGNPPKWCEVTYVKFSDGTELGIINEHALFDKTLNRYVYFNAENPAEYIGHKFVTVQNVNGGYVSGEVTLIGFENREEFVRVFSPVSLFHMNVVTNGLLSMTAWPTNSEGFENYFAFDEDMNYDEEAMQADIEKYGLYTYEDFKGLMTEDLFNALPWKYFKIAVGKGMMTWDDILYTIDWIYTAGQIDLG